MPTKVVVFNLKRFFVLNENVLNLSVSEWLRLATCEKIHRLFKKKKKFINSRIRDMALICWTWVKWEFSVQFLCFAVLEQSWTQLTFFISLRKVLGEFKLISVFYMRWLFAKHSIFFFPERSFLFPTKWVKNGNCQVSSVSFFYSIAPADTEKCQTY